MRISARLMRQSLQFTDERSKLEGELVGGIDVVKCSAWEVCPPLFQGLFRSLTVCARRFQAILKCGCPQIWAVKYPICNAASECIPGQSAKSLWEGL